MMCNEGITDDQNSLGSSGIFNPSPAEPGYILS